MGAYELAIVGLVGSSVGALLGTPFVWPGHPRRTEVRVLGAAVLAVAALGGLISARLAGLVPATAAVSHLVNALGLLAFPLAVSYVRLATGAARPLTGGLVAPLLAYAAIAALRTAATGRSDVPFLWLLPVAAGFTLVGAVEVWRGQVSRDALVPPAWVVGFMALVNVAQVARMDLAHVPVARAGVPLALGLGVVVMMTWVVWQQVSTEGMSAAPVPAPPSADAGAANEPAASPPTARYERSTLDDAAAQALLVRIDSALTANRLFARPDLTLAALARETASTPHLVSEALNRVGGTSFRDLVNRRRVDDVKAQLADPRNDGYTIEGLGASAGFGSRSALYHAFRLLEGTTPTAYRARLRDARDAARVTG